MDVRWVVAASAAGWVGVAVGRYAAWRAMRAKREGRWQRAQMWLAASQTADPITSLAMLEALVREVPHRNDREAMMRWLMAGGKPLDPQTPKMIRRAYIAVYEAANPPQEL